MTKATSKYNTQRATSDDIKESLKFVSYFLGIPVKTLKQDLLGSTVSTLLGKKKDSGDIDIALSLDGINPRIVDHKMTAMCRGEGGYNPGSKIGSYALPLRNKKVQVDLMFVSNKDWARWIYHSSEGVDSKYKGVVRNILLFTALAYVQEPGKDFVIRENGRAVIRASRSVLMDSGMQRLFKMASISPRNGKYSVGLKKVDPSEIEAHLKQIGKEIKFSHDPDITDDPNIVAAHIFGQHVKGNDLMTAENVIKHIHKMPNADEVIKACKVELMKLDLPVPQEL